MDETDKLRVLLPHWVEHNDEHAGEFRRWAESAGPARERLIAAARLVQQANDELRSALQQLGGPYHPHQEESDE
jgi:hypothetical protein